jgi:hypothetical protein
MKQTHKLRGLSNVAETIAAAPNVSAAARRLGVSRGTVHRWLAAGKVPAPGTASSAPPNGASQPGALPTRLADITLTELTTWAVSGPLLSDNVAALSPDSPYVVWPCGRAFFEFYAQVREEWAARRRGGIADTAAERLFQVSRCGGDVEAERDAIAAERDARDPRRIIFPLGGRT